MKPEELDCLAPVIRAEINALWGLMQYVDYRAVSRILQGIEKAGGLAAYVRQLNAHICR